MKASHHSHQKRPYNPHAYCRRYKALHNNGTDFFGRVNEVSSNEWQMDSDV
jgi:hypothetical protein